MRFPLLTLLLTVFIPCRAQSELEKFSSRLSGEGLDFDYSCEILSVPAVKAEGSASIYGLCYCVRTNGLDIFCDGKSRWIVDSVSKEVCIESVDDSETDVMINPAGLLNSLSTAFKCQRVSDSTMDGKRVRSYSLVPCDGVTGVGKLVIYFSGQDPVASEIVTEDGQTVVFRLYHLRYGQGSKKTWSFDQASLDSEYVVTDLR